MSAAAELQETIYNALVADADVGALIGDRIYDAMPSSGSYPCVVFGDSQEVTDDADCYTSEEHFVDLHVWSRDQGRLGPCKIIVSAVKAALHEADLSMDDPYALVEIRVTDTRTFKDQDGITAHGVVSVKALVDL